MIKMIHCFQNDRKINQKIYVKRVPRLQHKVERERERDEKEEV